MFQRIRKTLGLETRSKMLERIFLCQRCFVASEEAAVAYIDEMVDGDGQLEYVDKVGSVSALTETETDYTYDPTHIELNRRLIHNGS